MLSKLAKTRCALPNNQHNIITMRSVGLRVIFILFIHLLIFFFSQIIDRQHPDRRCSSCRCIMCSQTIRLICSRVAQPRRSEIVLHHTVCVGTITRPWIFAQYPIGLFAASHYTIFFPTTVSYCGISYAYCDNIIIITYRLYLDEIVIS